MDAIEPLLQPIPGDNPAGPSLRYDPVYDEIKRAREEEDDNLPQGEWKRELKVADFPLVRRLATEVLSERSKDLQIAAWLTEAWTRLEGFEGMNRGFLLLRRLMEEFWDGIHPEIDDDGDMEFRAVPLEWVGRYMQTSVELVPLTEGGYGFLNHRESRLIPTEAEAEKDSQKRQVRRDAEASGQVTPEAFEEGVLTSSKEFIRSTLGLLDEGREELSRLEEFCDERFGDVSPTFIPLRELLDQVQRLCGQNLQKKLEVDPDPVTFDEPGEDETSGDGAPGEATGDPIQAGGGSAVPTELGSPSDAIRLAVESARFLRRATPTNPSPYLILRGLRWGELRAAGDPVEPKLLVAPPTQVRTRIRGFALDGKWEQLLDACEEVMATPHGRGWLDLQRYVLEACEALGADYDPVAGAIRTELHGLLQDLPSLVEATLMDDTPAANEETRSWLRDSVGVGREAPAGDPSGDPDRAFDRRVARVRTSSPQEAIQLLIQKANQERSARARFLRRCEAAAIMVETGLEAVALPILRELSEQVERHNLEEWEEGETVARALSLLSRSLIKRNGESGETQELYLRICRLDPLEAMRLDGASGTGG